MVKMRGYYAKSCIVTRATGIPYRQNDVTLNARNGRLLIRSQCVEELGLGEEDCVILLAKGDGRLKMIVRRDRNSLLSQHLRFVPGQRNMQTNARRMARQWCMKEHTDELRLRIKAVVRIGQDERMLELERVNDLCEATHWDSRRKKKDM